MPQKGAQRGTKFSGLLLEEQHQAHRLGRVADDDNAITALAGLFLCGSGSAATATTARAETILARQGSNRTLIADATLATTAETARAFSNGDIAKSLDISENVVKEHVLAILKRIDAANRTEAVSIAYRHHLI